jgi:flap endonuclease-1
LIIIYTLLLIYIVSLQITMGVKGITAIIHQLAPDAIRDVHPSSFRGKTVAVDTMLIIYKFMIGMLNSGGQLKRSDGKVTTHLNGFMYKIKNMLQAGILPVFVIDGKSPSIKKNTIKKRQDIRDRAQTKLYELEEVEYLTETEGLQKIQLEKKVYRPTKEVIRDVKYLITLFGLPLIQAKEEADPQCAALNIANKVDCVISDDMDTLFFGAPRIAKNFSTKKKFTIIDLKTVLIKFKFTYDQFVEFGILLGCDYCSRTISGLKGVMAFKKYKQYGSIENLIKGLGEENAHREADNKKPLYNIPEEFKNNWRNVKEYYLTTDVYDPETSIDIKWNKPDYEGIFNFLVRDNQFNKNKVLNLLDDVRDMYKYYATRGLLTISKHQHKRSKRSN